MKYTGNEVIDNAMKKALAAAKDNPVKLSKEREDYLKSKAFEEDKAFMNVTLEEYLQTA